MDVTAIVPTYNRAEYLGECLTSLLAQTRPPDQLIVVDDGSTDDTRDVLRSFGTALEHQRQENAGKAAALNRALPAARGEAIWIFDDDDVAAPEALELLTDGLTARPGAGFTFGAHDSFAARDEPVAPRAPALDASVDLDDLFHGILTRRFYVFQGATLVRRECYEQVGPFDESFARAQDFDMLARLAARYEATQVDEVVLHQRQHAGDRGPVSLRIDGREVWDRQYDFDVRVAQKVHETMPPEVFLARRDRRETAERSAALLRRAGVMLQWGLWDEATADLRALAGSAAPRPSLASSITADFRDGAERMRLEDGAGGGVLDAAMSLPPGAVRDELVATLLWPQLRQTMKAAMRGHIRSDESRALRRHGRHLPITALVRLGRVGAARVGEGALRRARRGRPGGDTSDRPGA